MSVRRTTAAIALGCAALVAVTELAAHAATGGPLLLGGLNQADRPTVLESSSGPALRLRVAGDTPPLTVSSPHLVPRLNADKLDGQDARALRTEVYRFTEARVDQPLARLLEWDLPAIPDGPYLMSWDVNLTPFEPGVQIECGLTQDDYDRQWGNDTALGRTDEVAVWLSGAALVDLDADTQHFYCQTDDSAEPISFKKPLTVAFQRVDRVRERTLVPITD